MEKQYKQSTREITHEIARMTGKGIKDTINKIPYVKGFAYGLALPPRIALAAPTTRRRFFEEVPEEYNEYSVGGGALGVIFSTALSIPFMCQIAETDWRYLMIPVATNVISGIYEFQRKAKKNLGERSDLEQAVEGGK